MCFWRHPTYLAWEIPLFSKTEPNFSIKNGFTWETNPGHRNVPACYLRPLPRAESLVVPFSGADACRIRTGPVREGSTTFFKNQHRNAIPARQSGVRVSPKLMKLLVVTKTAPCPWIWPGAWAWAWHDQVAMCGAWYGEVHPPVPRVRT